MKRLEVNSGLYRAGTNVAYPVFNWEWYKQNEPASYKFDRQFGKRQYIIIFKLHHLLDNRIMKDEYRETN